jgi:hypothetical protein
MKTADEVFADIVASRPAGYFAETEVLLRRYCELVVEGRINGALLARAHQEDDLNRALELGEASIALTSEMCDIAEILGLLPGDRGKPPPRAQ